MMMFFRALIAAPVLVVLCFQEARAHSWYPHECCSDGDCSPADAVFVDAHGETIVITGMSRLVVPHGFPIRSSPDNRVHICFSRSNTEEVTPIYCIFAPGHS